MPAYSPNFSYVGVRWLKRQGVTAALLVGSNVNNTKKMFLIPKKCYICHLTWLKNGEIFHFQHEIMSFVLVLTRLVVRMTYLLFRSVVVSAHYSIESLSPSLSD